MARFNSPALGTKTVNRAGGESFKESPQLELVSILLTSMVQDQYYSSALDTIARLRELIKKGDKKFAAKAAIYARNEFGLRSISHVTAGEIAALVKGEEWTKKFYELVVRRVDDITEILSSYLGTYGKPIPNSLKKGLAKAFDKFDEYQLAKYRAEGKQLSLVDAVNLLHPTPSVKTADALAKLVKGTLKSKDTWETKLTQAGQTAESTEQKAEKKAQAWGDMLSEGRLGYMALLRNLRNILKDAPDAVPMALEQLVDEKSIRGSLVFPFRFLSAYKELQRESNSSEVLGAIVKACEISLANIPKLKGATLIAIDTSGSMSRDMSEMGTVKLVEVGALLGFALQKTQGSDVCEFAQNARYINAPIGTPALTQTIHLGTGNVGHATDISQIFRLANRKYDRIIILSDMQTWAHYDGTPSHNRAVYAKRFGVNPFVYSVDLAGYGQLAFPENGVYCVAGFSDKIFGIMNILEQDKKALVNTIDNYVDL